jgi:hypothetical protein
MLQKGKLKIYGNKLKNQSRIIKEITKSSNRNRISTTDNQITDTE